MTTTAPSTTHLIQGLSQYAEEKERELLTQYPAVEAILDNFDSTRQEVPVQTSVLNQVSSILAEQPSAAHQTAQNISFEEYESIIEKIKILLSYPAGHLQTDSELYLEQQLSDILGFGVTASLDNQRLPFTTGMIKALPHQLRFPDDKLEEHSAVLEAGIAQKRGDFGWLMQPHQHSADNAVAEKYSFCVPLTYLPNWQADHQRLRAWYKKRKVVVINPQNQRAVVGVIADIGPSQTLKYQFGASPEVIREGLLWSPQAQGRVIMLFVDDASDKVPLGLVDFTQAAPQS
jgi:hypothetical protein